MLHRIRMFALTRGLTYAALFVGFVLVFLPAQVVDIEAPAIGGAQIAGAAVVVGGLGIALWCVLTFGLVGEGTPAPFDPPRKLVMRGPYRYVRNPMYLGADLALVGAALFYGSGGLVGFALAFALTMHGMVRLYEEPTLRRQFGDDYTMYCENVRRWLPRWR